MIILPNMKSIIGKKINTVNSPKIVAGGSFTSYNGTAQNYITRLNSNGTLDTGFTIGMGFQFTVTTMAVQSDGKIIVGGFFTSYNGTTQNRITRLNSDGTRDTSFTIGTGFNTGQVRVVAIQPDGKIVAGGSFTSYNGTTQNRITRLNSDGTRDTSFSIGTGFFSGQVNSIAIQPDGKILACGTFTMYRGAGQNRIIRLNSDGSRDDSFSIGTGFNSTAISLAIQPDGKILVGGSFITYNGISQERITRLNSNGSIDTIFDGNVGSGFSSGNVNAFAIQSDGKILVGGTFIDYNGVSNQRSITRLNANGTLDDTFLASPGFGRSDASNPEVNVITIQADGKILAGGNFEGFRGEVAYSMIRLNPNGSRDDSLTGAYSFISGTNIYTIILTQG